MGIWGRAGLVIAMLLAGCASQQEIAKREANIRSIERNLEVVREGSTLKCATPLSCQKVWTLARTYAQRQSATTIQTENDRVMRTFNPVDYGSIGLTVTRVPGPAAQSIQIEGVCKGMYSLASDGRMEAGPKFDDCALLLLRAYQGLPEYVNRELTR